MINQISICDSELEEAVELCKVGREQTMLSICKCKGMPVIGAVYLSLHPDYIFEERRDLLRYRTTYSWRPIVLPG